MLGTIAYEAIQKYRPQLDALSKNIWEHPEGPFVEYQACQWTAKLLEQAGFHVETGVFGLPTAIMATWGSGHPIVGLMGEYDALPGLSQALSPEEQPNAGQKYGHGCGHNLLDAAHVGAAIGLKEEMEQTGLTGTIVFYGCPAEEVLTGKPFMAKEHAFDCLDLAIAFHPGGTNSVFQGINAGINSLEFHYKGRTAHAGGDPYNGRSALDALELTNVGTQYLREHVTDDVRIHYMTLEGGTAPNIVPDKASSWYMVRAYTRERIEQVCERLIKVAKGAAMMTETEVEVRMLGGCYPTMQNRFLADVLQECMHQIPWEKFDDEDRRFSEELRKSNLEASARSAAALHMKDGELLYEGVRPIIPSNSSGSFDMGDVCHIVPTIMFSTTCRPVGTPNHHWQNTACSGAGIGEKGMINAAKVMALFGLRVMTDPTICEKAKKEFDESMSGREYKCPIPDGTLPPVER